MNADERAPGQQGYGQQSSQERQPGKDENRVPDTGQAAYGNSGQADVAPGASPSPSEDQHADSLPEDYEGTTDIEVERSQGREPGIEGAGL